MCPKSLEIRGKQSITNMQTDSGTGLRRNIKKATFIQRSGNVGES